MTAKPVTKWDLLSEEDRRGLERTTCGVECTGCGEPLITEADFAQHFILYNRTYLNIGYCPVAGPKGQRW